MEETQLERHEQEILRLREKVDGLPERLANVEREIAILSSNINDFIRELRKGYVSNDVCQACRESLKKDIDSNKDNIRFTRGLMWAVAGGAVSLFVGALVTKLI